MADEIRRESTGSASGGGPPGGYGGGYGSGSYSGQSYSSPSYGSTAIDKAPMIKRISWGAIFAGSFVALALSVLLWLLGAAVGFAAFDPATPAGTGWMWGIGIWGIIVAMVSLFTGGLVAAWLAGLPKWMDAMLHGLVVWALATTAAFALTGMLGATVAGGLAATLDPQQMGMGQPQQQFMGMGDSWRQDPRERVRSELQQELPSEDDWFTWGNDRRQYTEREIDQFVRSIQRGQGEQVVSALVRDGDLEPQVAQRRVQEWQQLLQRGQQQQRVLGAPQERDPQAERETREAVDAATNAATWGFFALLLGACAAAVGGAIGRPSYMEDRITQGGHPRYTPEGYQHTSESRGENRGPGEYRSSGEHRGSGGSGGEYRGGDQGRYQPPPTY